ncbi:MAG: FkbM family methyltransferase [Elusimicrobia bacterium]|nr:FkbM family methyltransferase [Elusimicrobiota bacterium]
MALAEAVANIRSNYAFHARLRGDRAARLGYLTVYYALFTLLRWGDRHLRALNLLKAWGLSDAPVEVETPDGLTLDLDLHTAFDPLYSIVGEEDYERAEGFALKPGMVVVDLGANLGVFAARAAKRVGPEGRVVAVEPHPDNFARLKGNAERNGLKNLDCVNAAAGDHEGEVALFVHERGINHSLVRGSGKSLPVRLTTVDALVKEKGLARVDFLKVDIEGVVPEALRGASDTLKRFRPLIALERDSDAESRGLDEILAAHGYAREDRGIFTYARPSAPAA